MLYNLEITMKNVQKLYFYKTMECWVQYQEWLECAFLIIHFMIMALPVILGDPSPRMKVARGLSAYYQNHNLNILLSIKKYQWNNEGMATTMEIYFATPFLPARYLSNDLVEKLKETITLFKTWT